MKSQIILMITRKTAHDTMILEKVISPSWKDSANEGELRWLFVGLAYFGFLVENFNFEVADFGKLSSMFWAFSTISLLQRWLDDPNVSARKFSRFIGGLAEEFLGTFLFIVGIHTFLMEEILHQLYICIM